MLSEDKIERAWEEIKASIDEEMYDHHYDINQTDGQSRPALTILREAMLEAYSEGYKDGEQK